VAQLHSPGAARLHGVLAAQPGLTRSRSVQCARGPRPGPAWPDVRVHTARQACSAVATSPAHGSARGEGHGGASPVSGRQRGRACGVDGGTVKTTAPRLTGRSRRRRRPDEVDGGVDGVDGKAWTTLGHAQLNGDQRGGGGIGRSASVMWRARTRMVGDA
jgi:hypothetical protein